MATVRVQPNNCTLYEIEDTLAAFVDAVDLAADEPTRQLVLDEIGQALRKAKDKRDAVVAFLQALRAAAGVCRRRDRAHRATEGIYRPRPGGAGALCGPGD